jgi:hypothetical protein
MVIIFVSGRTSARERKWPRPTVRSSGAGIFIDTTPAPCPVTLVIEAVQASRAEWIPQTNGRGLSAREHLTMIASRNEAFRLAERTADGDDLAVAEHVGKACEMATERTLRAILADRRRAITPASARRERFTPSLEDCQAAAQMFADEETDRLHEAMEAACQQAEYYDRMVAIG